MYSRVKLAYKFLEYFITSSNGKGHGVHSPFVFDFITTVLNDRKEYECYQRIEQIRHALLRDDTSLTLEDMGAGSRVHPSYKRKVSEIAKSSLKPKKFAQLLFRMVLTYQPANILELGTSLGITTAYLASGTENGKVITMEGAAAVARIAAGNLERLHLKNIRIVEGNFDETLQHTVDDLPSIDLAFIDGNHRREPTLRYFQQLLPRMNDHSIIVFDDIHWSSEMEDAWETVKSNDRVTLSIDLFFVGIIFFRKEQKAKQHFSIRF